MDDVRKAPRGGVRLTDEQVLEVRRRLAAGEPGTVLEQAFGISSAQVSRIKTGKRHSHLGGALSPVTYDPEWKCSACGDPIARPKHNITKAQRAKKCCGACKKTKNRARHDGRMAQYEYKPKVDLTDVRFGRLVATKPGRRGQWECLCDCGRTKQILAGSLRSGNTQSCGCLALREGLEKLREQHDRGIVASYDGYRRGARARKLAFELPIEAFTSLVTSDCHYCGAKPAMAARGSDRMVTGIDRMDNGVGYVAGNCAPCCTTCNYMKRTMGAADFIALACRIAARHAERNA